MGHPMNLQQHFQNLPETPDLNAESGRGLFLIKEIADQLHYVRVDDQRNCLLIVKYNAQPSMPSPAQGKSPTTAERSDRPTDTTKSG